VTIAPDPPGEPTIDSPPPDGAAAQAVADPDGVLTELADAVDAMPEAADFAALDTPRRLLLVHAHPDDETVGTGATIALEAARGTAVTLVTCTLGERGAVVAPDLAHLAWEREDTLGAHRVGELAEACRILGIGDHRFLGGPGRWRDSDMMGNPGNDDRRCFWQADQAETTAALVEVIREVRPQVAATYDANGAYGHPDHIQAHRVTEAAVTAAADASYRPDLGEPWSVTKLYWTAIPRSVLQQALDTAKASGEASIFGDAETVDDLGMGTPDELVTTAVDGRAHFDTKIAAMLAHRSQIGDGGPFKPMMDRLGDRGFGIEHYTLSRGVRGPGEGEHGWEADLFAGIEL